MSSWSILSKPLAEQLSTITVMTYGKWMLEAGRKVKRGEKCNFAKMQAKASAREAEAGQQPSA